MDEHELFLPDNGEERFADLVEATAFASTLEQLGVEVGGQRHQEALQT